MNIKAFNLCLLLGWLMLLAGGIVIHPGWGLAIAGAVLMAGTLAVAYLAGLHSGSAKAPAAKGTRQDGANADGAA